MSIPKDVIEIIRDRARIEDVVRKYVPSLAKKGKNYLGLCPFHKEKTPSFTVSPEKQIYYCFGCHEKGNVFTFLEKYEKLTFPEAVRMLGDMYGIEVREEARNDESRVFERLLAINRAAMECYREALMSPAGSGARDYLSGRGVSAGAVSEFMLGYAPDEWHYLTAGLRRKNLPVEEAARLGLVSVSDKGGNKNYYDRFRKRIIFPIVNPRNEIIAFGGRIMDAGEPKYLNSPESDLFKKSLVLYGFNIAAPHLSELKRAIIVEGYLDVIGCHQAGIRNVVAPMGTALTVQQLRLLSRYCTEVIVLFDADAAGVKASLRSLEVAKDINIDVKVAVLPEDDPFDFIKKRGPREFMAVVDSALKPVDFRMERVFAESKLSGRVDVLKALFGILKDVEYETERSRYISMISSRLQLREDDVRADFARFAGKTAPESRPRAVPHAPAASTGSDFITRSYRDLVALMMHYPELVKTAMIDISAEEITDRAAQRIFMIMGDEYSSGDKISIDRLIDLFPDGDERRLIEENLFREFSIENPLSAYTEIFLNLKRYLIDQKIELFAQKIKGAGPGRDMDVRDYLTEIEILRREKEKLSSHIYNRNIIS